MAEENISTEFKLKNIVEARNYFVEEIEQNELISKKHKMVCTTLYMFFFFFSIWVLFHKHSRFTGQQGKGEGIYLTPLYHFHRFTDT